MLILVVDDQEGMRRLGRMIVEGVGYAVETCSSAESALEYLRGNSAAIHLVISDYDMGGMTGMDFLREIRNDPRFGGIRFILMTGGYNVGEEEALQQGVDGFLEKPFNPQALLEMISRFTR